MLQASIQSVLLKLVSPLASMSAYHHLYVCPRILCFLHCARLLLGTLLFMNKFPLIIWIVAGLGPILRHSPPQGLPPTLYLSTQWASSTLYYALDSGSMDTQPDIHCKLHDYFPYTCCLFPQCSALATQMIHKHLLTIPLSFQPKIYGLFLPPETPVLWPTFSRRKGRGGHFFFLIELVKSGLIYFPTSMGSIRCLFLKNMIERRKECCW